VLSSSQCPLVLLLHTCLVRWTHYLSIARLCSNKPWICVPCMQVVSVLLLWVRVSLTSNSSALRFQYRLFSCCVHCWMKVSGVVWLNVVSRWLSILLFGIRCISIDAFDRLFIDYEILLLLLTHVSDASLLVTTLPGH
jgi:hypothetical protein